MRPSLALTRSQFRALVGLAFAFAGILAGLSLILLPTLPGAPPASPPTLSANPPDTEPAATPASPEGSSALTLASQATATVAPTAGAGLIATQPIVRETDAPPRASPSALPIWTATLAATLPVTPIASATAGLSLTPANPSRALPAGWPQTFPELTASKLSVHVVRNEDPQVMQMVRQAHPRLIKAVDDVGWLAEVKQVSPGTIIIGRFTDVKSDTLEEWTETKDPQTAAREYVAAHLERYRRNPAVDFWEGWNEFSAVPPESWVWFARFEAERACLMQAHGLRAAVGGFPPGTPEYGEMALFAPALEAAHRCGGIFTLHEGVMPIIGCGVSATDPEVRIPGAPDFPGVAVGYMTVRYRYWYEGFLKPRGVGDLPLVISELALGGFVEDSPCNGPGGADWKSFQKWWVQQGVAGTGPEAYMKVLAWYDQLMREDPYVLGATIFTAGAISPELNWNDFDVHEVLPLLTDHLLQSR